MDSSKTLVLAVLAVGLLAAGALGGSAGLVPVNLPARPATGSGGAVPSTSSATPLTSTNITTAALTVFTTLPTYTLLPEGPVPVDFQLNVTNATITPQNVTLWVAVTDSVTGVICENLSLESLVTNVSNTSNVSSRSLQTSFDLNSSTANLTTLEAKCPRVLSDTVEFVVSAAVNGAVKPIDGTFVTTNSSVTPVVGPFGGIIIESTTPGTALVFAEPTEALVFSSSTTLSTYDLSASYTGQYVGQVALTIYSATTYKGTRSVLLSSNLAKVGGKPTVAAWYEPRGGNYPYTLQLYTPYGGITTSGILAVTNASYVYYNTTTNTPIGFGGMGPAASATVLLVVGLVIGFLTMFAVARWVLGPPGGGAPKQWSGAEKPAASGGGAHSCTFCGRTFGSPEDLASHAKSEHGVE